MNIHYAHSLDHPKPLERWVLLPKKGRTVKLSEAEEVESYISMCVFVSTLQDCTQIVFNPGLIFFSVKGYNTLLQTNYDP